MTRLTIHPMAQGGTPQAAIAEKCRTSLRPVERILSEPEPMLPEVAANPRQAAPRRGRPPKADPVVVEQVRARLAEDGSMRATEVLRRSRAWGDTGGQSAMSALVKQLRPSPKREPQVCFDGMPGEYAPFAFGKCRVKLASGRREQVIVFAGRLPSSRFMNIVLVENERAETVVRSLIACLMAFGGSPKEWVFDHPRTIRRTRWGVEPVPPHPYMRDLVAEDRVIPTFCAPRSGRQKGAVENLVGSMKKSFPSARKFKNREELEPPLSEGLHTANHPRPCSATGVIPVVALQEERRWLEQRPVRTPADEHPLRDSATVTPLGTISRGGTRDVATARRIGAPATLLVRRDTIEIIVAASAERCVQPRRDGVRTVQRLPGQGDDMLGAVHGRRKQATCRRPCLVELGPPAREVLGVRVHVGPDARWEQPCAELFDQMQAHGDEPMRAAFVRCVAQRRYPVADLERALREVAYPPPPTSTSAPCSSASTSPPSPASCRNSRRGPPPMAGRTARSWFTRSPRRWPTARARGSRRRPARPACPSSRPSRSSTSPSRRPSAAASSGPCLGPEFVSEGRDLIPSGKPGRGKTPIALALACRAIQNGFAARFVTASALIDELRAAAQSGKLREVSARYVQPHVLVIDEVGAHHHAAAAANVRWGIIDPRCLRRRPVVFTTNKEKLREWGEVLHDHPLAEALLDRVLERGLHIHLGGRSWRRRGIDDDPFAAPGET